MTAGSPQESVAGAPGPCGMKASRTGRALRTGHLSSRVREMRDTKSVRMVACEEIETLGMRK